jgi:hypothetical protein
VESASPSQSSSTPLQSSASPGLMAASPSSQSVASAVPPAGASQETEAALASPKPSPSPSVYQVLAEAALRLGSASSIRL